MKGLRPWRTVRGRLLMAAILVEATMLSLLVGNSLRLLSANMTNQASDHAAQITPVLNAALVAPLAQKDYATLQAILNESRAVQGIDYVAVTDTAGKRVAGSGWPRDLALPRADAAFHLFEAGSSPRYNVASSVKLAGQELGTLQFGLDLSRIVAAHRQLLTQGIAIAVGELLLSAGLLALLGFWLTRQLTDLTRASEAVARGNLTPPPVQEGEDDVGRLGRAFNVMSRTISERIRELTLAREEAEAGNRAKDAFLATMSHELRTPMNGVLGMLGLLLGSGLDEKQRRFAESARSSSQSLLGIINDVLDLSKVEAGVMELEEVDFDLQALLDELAFTLAHQARGKALALAVAPAPEGLRRLRGDPGRLKQVLNNLVNNAIKFTPSGSVAIRVEDLSGEGPEPRARFVVRDTGIGIPAGKFESLFERFTQVDATITRKFGGTGLGLAISRQIVLLLGGEIGVASEEGRGSEFWFTARFRPPLGEGAAPASRPGYHPVLRDYRGARVLLAEDNPMNQEVARAVLESWNLEVDLAENGAVAVEALRRSRYDLVLMDLQMPVMDGLEATRVLRDPASGVLDPKVPVVAMTAHAMQDFLQRCLDAGMDGYQTKPIDPGALAGVLDRFLPSAPGPEAAEDPPGPAVPAPAGPAPALFDREAFLGRVFGNRDAADRILAAFRGDAPKRLAQVQAAAEAGDAAAAARDLHTLKGALGNLGANAMRARVVALESAAKAGDLEALCAGLPALTEDLQRLSAEVEAWAP